MTGQDTTPPAGPGAASLRELAVAAADRADRERARFEEVTLAQAMERVADIAAGVAVEVLGEVAQAARWTALDAEGAVALTGGQRFRFRLGHDAALDPHVLYHAIACGTCGGVALAEISDLADLGKLLRDQPQGSYRCETCAAGGTRAPGRTTTVGLPLPTRDEALRMAVQLAGEARDYFDSGEVYVTQAMGAAAVSQAWSALARTVDQSWRTDEAGA